MKPGSSSNLGAKYLITVIDIFAKYTWVKRLKDKKAKSIFCGFLEIVSETKHRPSKLWVDQRREFCKNANLSKTCYKRMTF